MSTAREVIDYVRYGMRHRHEDSTKVHSHSSRSHLIVQLNIYQTNHSGVSKQHTVADAGSNKKQQQSSSIPVRSRFVNFLIEFQLVVFLRIRGACVRI